MKDTSGDATLSERPRRIDDKSDCEVLPETIQIWTVECGRDEEVCRLEVNSLGLASKILNRHVSESHSSTGTIVIQISTNTFSYSFEFGLRS